MSNQMDYLDLDPTPYDEKCAQVGQDDYAEKASSECLRFIAGCRKYFVDLIGNHCLLFSIKSNPHDFGSYLSVRIKWYSDDEEAGEIAYTIENNIPDTWQKLETGIFSPPVVNQNN